MNTFNALFLKSGTSTSNVLAECLLNHLGQVRVRTYGADSRPADRANPYSLDVRLFRKLNQMQLQRTARTMADS